MPYSLPGTTHSASTSSDSSFESDTLSSPHSVYCSDFCYIQPNDNSHLPDFASVVNRDDTIFSFAWSDSDAIDMSEPTPAAVVDSSKVPHKSADKFRHKPPTLPAPIFWSTLTHHDDFEEYIKLEGIAQGPMPADVDAAVQVSLQADSSKAVPVGSVGKSFSNIAAIEALNASHSFVAADTPLLWVQNHLFADEVLPTPFDDATVRESKIWAARVDTELGADTFRTIPSLTEPESMKWLNTVGEVLGCSHGILNPDIPSKDDFGWTPSSDTAFRMFNHAGRNKALTGGFNARKPDMVLFDRDHPYQSAPPTDRLDWGPVRALVEVSIQDSHYTAMMTTLLHKAANMFHCQFHRQYVLGLAFFGKGDQTKFFFTIIDRAGALSTEPALLNGFNAMVLARIIYAFTFGSDELLGMDPNVIIDRVTGLPTGVRVENQLFTIVKQLHVSPILFGRGTRVYMVQDQNGHYHICKDSWILLSHAKDNSEIEHLKLISAKAKRNKAKSPRSYVLHPRFVAGDGEVYNSNTTRGYARVVTPARIRRRMINGPIGDPLTSYCSRVELLQVFIDVVDELIFLRDECKLLHGDISMGNIVIVRFLQSIIEACGFDLATFGIQVEAEPLPAEPLPQAVMSATADSESSTHSEAPLHVILADADPEGSMPPENPLPVILADTDTASPATPDGPSNNIRIDVNFLKSLGSGGAIIDFDYARSINGQDSVKASGTVPYMSIELSRYIAGDPEHSDFSHRIDHDVESLLLVFLHIVRFTCGPKGNLDKDIFVNDKELNITQWHHESKSEQIAHHKSVDVLRLRSIRTLHHLLPAYWRPIAPHIIKLIDTVYPSPTIPLRTGSNIHGAFRKELEAALCTCQGLEEEKHLYGMSMPFQTRAKKRKALTQGSAHQRISKGSQTVKRTKLAKK